MIDYFKELDNTVSNIKHELVKLCWYMRGGLEYDSAFMLSPNDRTHMAEVVKENIETVKKTNLPLL